MEHPREIEGFWEGAGLPALVLTDQDGVWDTVYCNTAARPLCRDYAHLLAQLQPEEAAALERAVGASVADPTLLFCHVEREVYSAVLMDWSGYRVCLLQKVSEYYQNNQRALDEAIMANKAKTSFLSEMSHDIRTPMGAIIGMTEIALAQGDAPPRVKECLNKIKVASGHMMSLLNEVLDMSRIESGRVSIQAEEINIADLLHEILIVALPQADAGQLHFHLETGSLDKERIWADGVRLKQVCLNLLSNAIKYTPAGGQVEFYFDMVTESAGRVRMTVRVTDTGIGMSREFLTKVFQPFEREEKSTVNKIQGTGLGMTITKNLVELMGGSIRVTSEPGKGSCFTVEIPFPAADDAWDDHANQLSGKRVLLLSGSEKAAANACRMLSDLHVEADWAKDAQDVVDHINDALFADQEYFALLTAEQVPGVDLMAFLPEVRQRMGQDFPILLLSENDWSQTEYMFTRAGVDGFIPLPLFRSRLAEGLYAYTPEGRVQQGPLPLGSQRRDFSRRHILLVEDNELNREIALELLSQSGLSIDTAENGREAVDRFAASAPYSYDMILMDIQMPIMNGLDATRAIRAMERTDAGQVPIIAMTANAFVEDVQASLDAGMVAHISKPLDMDKVFSTMELFLGREHP